MDANVQLRFSRFIAYTGTKYPACWRSRSCMMIKVWSLCRVEGCENTGSWLPSGQFDSCGSQHWSMPGSSPYRAVYQFHFPSKMAIFWSSGRFFHPPADCCFDACTISESLNLERFYQYIYIYIYILPFRLLAVGQRRNEVATFSNERVKTGVQDDVSAWYTVTHWSNWRIHILEMHL